MIDELVDEAQKRTPVIVVDMHGEATSEKVAMAKWLDGKVTAVFGTHTHIQTNDARVQPGGTAAITDAGMTGPHDSVIGVQAELAIRAMRTGMPVRFETASGDVRIEGVLVECGSRRPRDELRVRARLGAVSAPPIRYAANGDVHIAYQVIGEGPLDLVFVAGAITNLDVLWEMSDYRRVLRTARLLLAAHPVRQARHGAVRPRPRRHARGADGRRARDPGRGRLGDARR